MFLFMADVEQAIALQGLCTHTTITIFEWDLHYTTIKVDIYNYNKGS